MDGYDKFKVEQASSFDTIFSPLQPTVRDALKTALFDRTDRLETMVLEDHYLDVDYSSSYFLQQGRSFTPLSRRTQRIHMFSANFSRRQLKNASKKTIRILQSSYLGYLVLRPIQPMTLGRTFIKPPDSIDNKRAFYPCKREVIADLCGIPLKVEACPYISQDALVMACATASLWMSTNALANKVGLSIYTTTEITSQAISIDRPFGPILGARGLRLDEEEKALTAMGYDPKLWQYPDAERLVEACYVHIESGIPPILNIYFPRQKMNGTIIEGLHAITAVGHLLDTNYRRNAPFFNDRMYVASEFVPSFIINDDQNGPYLLADVSQAPRDELPYRAKIRIRRGNSSIIGYCAGLLIPFPPRVWLPGTSAMRLAAYWLNHFISKQMIPDNQIVLRPFLIRSNDYKEFLLKECANIPRASRKFISVYRSLSLPRYIWVVQYGYLNDWIGSDCDHLPIQGEFVFDSTLAPAVKPDWLCMHIQKGMLIREFIDEKLQTRSIPLPDDEPYVCSTSLSIRP